MIAVSRWLPDISAEQQQQYCACGARPGVLTQRVYTGKARKTDPIRPPLTWRPTGRFKHASAAFPTSRRGGQSEMPRGRRFASNRPRPSNQTQILQSAFAGGGSLRSGSLLRLRRAPPVKRAGHVASTGLLLSATSELWGKFRRAPFVAQMISRCFEKWSGSYYLIAATGPRPG